ncbi:hypothetical protein GCK72_026152 [Caenorhabditis remanei]|uniref:Uncharacterized protein n=1 Tax=Caenorhabditis remanei TaxID=31234 RepID=A0A6A5G525_CAERE|nr:hypothetical protein GCK72_026152 [Caenorhabditis remanei]KAF1749684.1 hypothetical protein GCK72_026152 [Caenorhabditis remanei]
MIPSDRVECKPDRKKNEEQNQHSGWSGELEAVKERDSKIIPSEWVLCKPARKTEKRKKKLFVKDGHYVHRNCDVQWFEKLLKTGIVYSKGCEETEKSCIAIISNGGCLMDLDLPEWKPQIKLHRFPKTRWHEEKNEIKRTDVVTSRGSTRNTPHYQPGGMGKNILNFSEYF